jgi:hypothetical protein
MEHMFVFMKRGTNMHVGAIDVEAKNIASVLPPNE